MTTTRAQIVAAATALRHELHRQPETAWQEERTAARIRRALDELAIPWRPCAGTGTLAWLARTAAGPSLAFRADIDALPITEASGAAWSSEHPGIMHACGHDGHTACLWAAAAWLKRHEAALPGPVSLLFQPAEEGHHGARAMIEDGALDGIDRIFGFHSWPPFPEGRIACPAGTIMAANGHFSVRLIGRGGHASQPEATRDPVLASAAAIVALQGVVSRRSAPQDAVVVSVTVLKAGTASNIIPEEASFKGTLRAPTTGRLTLLGEQVAEVLDGIARAHDCRVDYRFVPDYPATVNDAAAAAALRSAATGLFGDCLHHDGLPLLAAEDFSYYLERVPGAFALVGAGRPDPCHSPRFDFNDALIEPVLRLWARLAGAPEP